MATWTNIPDTVLEPGKPARSVDALALRDNPIAIAEGADGAPKIQEMAFLLNSINGNRLRSGTVTAAQLSASATENAWVLARIAAGTGFNGVGSYALVYLLGGYTGGLTVSGAVLSQGGVLAATSGAVSLASYSTLSGTWRIMGTTTGSNPYAGVTLALRIA